MKKMNKFLTALILIILPIIDINTLAVAQETETAISGTKQVFRFEDYPVSVEQVSVVKKPILSTRLAKQYKTAITTAMEQPVNFAGYYRVVTWGCGTDCRGFAIINKLTGKTYTLPGVEYVAGVMGNDEERLEYKENSRLFVITGSKNDKKEGKFYYLWSKEELKLLATFPLEKQDFSD